MSVEDLHKSIQDERKDGYRSRGLHTVVIRNLKEAVQRNEFNSHREIRDLIRKMKMSLSNAEQTLLDLFDEVKQCEHEYGETTYTFQRRVIGYVYVYRRACKSCGHPEYFQFNSDLKDTIEKPEWALNARQTYYNNDLG